MSYPKPSLSFISGVMGSGKTSRLIRTYMKYKTKGFSVILIKPDIDTRFGSDVIKSRNGKSVKADLIINSDSVIQNLIDMKKSDIIIIDEVQFLTTRQIEQLKELSFTKPIICYGLKTDYRTLLFNASKRLIELADYVTIIEKRCTTRRCKYNGTINALIKNGRIIKTGDSNFIIGSEDKFASVCYKCWYNSS